jgi:hypothetical protein
MVHLAFGVDHGYFDSILVVGHGIEAEVGETALRFDQAAASYQDSIRSIDNTDDLLAALDQLRLGIDRTTP